MARTNHTDPPILLGNQLFRTKRTRSTRKTKSKPAHKKGCRSNPQPVLEYSSLEVKNYFFFFFATFFFAGAFLATTFFLAGAFLATTFFFAGAFLATFFLAGAFFATAFFAVFFLATVCPPYKSNVKSVSLKTFPKTRFTKNDELLPPQRRARFCLTAERQERSSMETSMRQFVRKLLYFSTSFPQNL